MSWTKLGRIYTPRRKSALLQSHASNATPVYLNDDTYRIYYNARDGKNRSSVSYFDFDLSKMEVTNDFDQHVVAFGDENSYYSHGVSLGSFFEDQGQKRIFFMGWQIRGKDHWRGDIGAFELYKDGTGIRVGESPFLVCDGEIDKISLSYPWIIKCKDKYQMWYGSTLDWTSQNSEMIHVIHYAESKDCIEWNRMGTAFPYELGVAQAFSRPTIHIDKSGIYHMWFSFRSGDGTPYRIGYATSNDGIEWSLELERSGINVSEQGWDSEMICYPFVFEHKGRLYMLYNGNGFGSTGIGLAKWRDHG